MMKFHKKDYIKNFRITISLIILWFLVCFWQIKSHESVKISATKSLLTRVRDISSTLGVVIASDKRKIAVYSEQLKRALNELTRSEELIAIGILNPENKVVAASSKLRSYKSKMKVGEFSWDMEKQLFRAVDLVALGHSESINHREHVSEGFIMMNEPRFSEWSEHDDRVGNGPEGGRAHRTGEIRAHETMSSQEFKHLYRKFGLHKFAVVMNTESECNTVERDFNSRIVIAILCGLSIAGIALFWRFKKRSFGLTLDLMKLEEKNSHLKVLNLAAAGLAHEARNPLNVVRSKAQIMVRDFQNDEDLRQKCTVIVDEVDRISSHLNEFINYSKPEHATFDSVECRGLIDHILYSLEDDLANKVISVEVTFDNLQIKADKVMLRQVLFNLLLNCCRYVPKSGKVAIYWTNGKLCISDNGVGIETSLREDIFRPYFTCNDEGTGLGLAVVRKLCIAQGWSVGCEPTKQGALFIISGIEQALGGNYSV